MSEVLDNVHGPIAVRHCTKGEMVYYFETSEPVEPGHINSPYALEVYKKTGLCGFHQPDEALQDKKIL
jgi:hypothetical protein